MSATARRSSSRGVSTSEPAGWAGAHSIPYLLNLRGDCLVATPHPDLDRYHRKEELEGAPVEAQAVDIAWTPEGDDTLDIWRGSQRVASISCTPGEMTIQVDEGRWTTPRSLALRVLVDGPVLELATTGSNFGIAVATPPGRLSATTRGTPPQTRELKRTAQPESLPA